MKVALIHARVSNNAVPPLGLLSIASLLKEEGVEVTVWDPSSNNRLFLEEIARFAPDVIGVSVMTAQYTRAKEIIRSLKMKIPRAIYICGGSHISALPDEALVGLDADVAVVGEGELTLKEFCSSLMKGCDWRGIRGISYRQGSRVYHNPPRALIECLDVIPFTGRELLSTPFDWYLIPPGVIRGRFHARTTTMITGRGCPYKCIFCASNVIFGRRFRRRSVENVIAEILYLKNRYGVKGIWFLDDCFTLDRPWVEVFCSAVIARGVDIIWSCQARIDTLDEELLKRMKSAGCVQVEVGIESGSDKVLEALSKGARSKSAEEKFNVMKRLGLRTMASLMIGNPDESLDDIMITYRLTRRLKPDFIEFNVCTPYPGSRLYQMAREKGWLLRNKSDFGTDWSEHFTTAPVMMINIEPGYLLRLRSSLQNRYLWRNYSGIAKGFLLSPRHLFILVRSIFFCLREDFSAAWNLLRKRDFDALIWGFYAHYSNMARLSLRP